MRFEGTKVGLVCAGAALTLGGWALGQQTQSTRPNLEVVQAEQGMQVVLETVSAQDRRLWVRPKSQAYFRLTPKNSEEHYAPLPPHSLMLCHEFNFRGPIGESHAGFVCGTEAYALEAFGFAKEVQGDAPEPSRRKNMGLPAGR
jgi:hypothetical protein